MSEIVVRVRDVKGHVHRLPPLPLSSACKEVYKLARTKLSADSFLLLHSFPPTPLPDSDLTPLPLANGQLLTMRPEGPATLSPAKAKRGRSKKVRTGNTMSSKEEIAERLVSSSSSNWNSADPVEKFLRHAKKLALKKQYEIAEGNRRYAAALGGDFSIETIGANLADTVKLCRVQYKFGRSTYHEEEFKLMNEDLLRATLKEILGMSEEVKISEEEQIKRRERLRPFVIAEISPQVFWSLVHCFSCDFKSTFERLIPTMSWDFLDTRYRTKSSKAREAEANEEYARRFKKPKTVARQVATLVVPKTVLARTKLKLMQLCEITPPAKTKLVKEIGEEGVTKAVEAAREYASTEIAKLLVQDDALRHALKELLSVETVYDIMRLKVPGRIKLVAEETKTEGVTNTLEVAQREAEELLAKYSFLDEYRSRG